VPVVYIKATTAGIHQAITSGTHRAAIDNFWWQAVPLVAGLVKTKLKTPKIILCGNYPVLETVHAAHFCSGIDALISQHLDLVSCAADFSLYEERRPQFCALDLRYDGVIQEITDAMSHGVSHFAFFNENIFEDFENRLKPILLETERRRWNIWFHGICGVECGNFPLEDAKLLAAAHFSELHMEPQFNSGGLVDEPALRDVMLGCERAGLAARRGDGWEQGSSSLSMFLWIGRPRDDLERLVWNALKLVQLAGTVIPKPYSPTPGTEDYKRLAHLRRDLQPEDISPHRLPFAVVNGVEKTDYVDLYRLTAFLNLKVRSRSFDFLGNGYLAGVIRKLLADRKWDV